MTKSLNARIFYCWTLYCIVGCGLLPEMVMGARYLPTRRSIPTQLERNERLRELFQHILESERDAHLTAANQFADQLKLIQKKSTDFGLLPDSIKDYNDELGDEYEDRMEHSYDGIRKSYIQQQQQSRQKQPWRFVLLNYGHGTQRTQKPDQSILNGKLHNLGSSSDDLVPSRSQQLMQKLYRGKQQQQKSSAATNTNTDDLDWINSNNDVNSATEYDALYDDVNEKRSSSSNVKFDRYRRNNALVSRKEHLN